MTLTPEALDKLVERLEMRVGRTSDCIADAAVAIRALAKERETLAEHLDKVTDMAARTLADHTADDSLRTARDLERERCAMLAEMAGQMELAAKIRAEP